MCIIIRCHICNDIIPTTDLRHTICDKPSCQAAKRKYRKPWRNRRRPLYCEVCGVLIPSGENRRKYCCQEHHDIGHMRYQKEYEKMRVRKKQNETCAENSIT